MKIINSLLLVLFVLNSCSQLSWEESNEGVLVKEGEQNILFYQIINKDYNGSYARCNYIHPLWNLEGEIITEDFPEDHLHHRGIFWSWHQVWIGEKRIGDPWLIQDFEQNVISTDITRNKGGSLTLFTTVEWISERWKPKGVKSAYLQENTSIRVYPRTENRREIEFEIRLTALTDSLKLGGSEDKKGYGGFSARLRLAEKTSFTGPNGPIEPQTTSVGSPGYVTIDAVTIKDHPDNPDYPQEWILRRKNSMQNAKWPGSDAVLLPLNEEVILRYSIVIESDD